MTRADWQSVPPGYRPTPGDMVHVQCSTSRSEWMGYVTAVAAGAPQVLDAETAEHRWFPRGWVDQYVPRELMEHLTEPCPRCDTGLVTPNEQHYCRKADTTDGPDEKEESDGRQVPNLQGGQ